ncbi:MAG TPA: right-handed parallel beta-helix repeat-containing protein, partial [Bacteroidia bacterium]|nr:right-handed parallel beta-helix repeat-containing protein [Bacteroidia bacterium]
DGWEIINNTIHDITNIGIDASGGYKVSKNVALDVARNGVIRGNVVYNCKSPYASAAGIYADGADDVLIERNICYNNQYGFEIGCEEKNSIASGIIMRENIAYNNDEAGIALGGYNYPNTGKVDDCYINNNTFYNNDLTQKGQGELVLTHLENSVFINNIMHGGNKRLLFNSAIGNLLGNTFDYNNWFTIDTDSTKPMFKINGSNYKTFADYVGSALGWDSHSVFGNPNFVSGADFHLTTGSFAYNLGDPAFVAGLGETDFDLAPRKYDNRVDAGAYESQVPLRSTVSTYESKILTVYPNPCTTVLNISCDAEVQKIRVLNLSGNEVIVLPPIQILNIENFTSGFYILEVITSDQTILRKTFIKR